MRRNYSLLVIGLSVAALTCASRLHAQSTPSINGPTVVGIYPGTPFLQTIGTSNLGTGITFSATGLPSGMSLDPGTGIISGMAPSAGTYSVSVTASGSTALAHSVLNIVSGNTLALTPPMGWNSWNSSYENNVTAQLLEQVANAMVNSGMRNAGYDYINIDDAWALSTRNAQGEFVPNPALFPNGLQPVIAYIHSLGLKFGIYTDAGTMSCSGAQPGSYGYEAEDAAQFAAWGVDYVKEDYCNTPTDQATAISRYTTMSNALNSTGRSIVFNICEWGQRQPWTWGQSAGGNSWRTTYDMRDNWQFGTANPPANQSQIGVLDAINLSAGRESFAGPGHWNDPDMIMAGVNGAGSSGAYGGPFLTTTEEQTQVSMWAMLAAPLIVNADLRQMDPTSPSYSASFAATYAPMLENNEIIKVDQDPLGKQASRIINNTTTGQQIWLKPLADGSYAVALLNTASSSQNMTVNWSDLGIGGQWSVRDLWAHANEGTFNGSYTAMSVPSHGTIVLDLASLPAPGVTLYWDINGTNPGSGAGGTTGGAWSANTWNSTADGTGTPGAWVAGADAVFSAGTDGTGSYTVNTGSTQTVRNLTVAAGNVTLGTTGGFALLPAATWGAASGASLTVALPVMNNGNLFTVSTTGATAISGAISGGGGLAKAGTGTLSLNAANSFTGQTTVNAGLVVLNQSGASGTLYQSSGLVINGGTVNAPADNSITGYNYAAIPVTINSGGMLAGGSGTTAGSTHIGALTLAGGTLASNGYNATWGGWYMDGDIEATGGGTSTISAQQLAIAGTATRTFNVDPGSVLNFTGNTQENLNGAVTGALRMAGRGLMILGGTNAYHGNTIVSGGTLQVGIAGAIPSGSNANGAFGNVVFDTEANTAVLDINGFDTTINGLVQNSLSTTNMVVNNASGATKTLTVGNNNTSSTFAGVLADNTNGGSGVLALAKIGNGTLTLLGNNSFTGPTTLAAGTLILNGANATTSISAAAGTTLSGNGSASSAVATIASGATVSAGYNGAGSLGLGGLTFLGGGTVAVLNPGNYSSSPAISVTMLTTSSTPITISVGGTIPTGSGAVHIIGYSGSIGGSGYNFVLGSPVSGGRNTYALANHPGYVDFTYAVDYPYWTGTGNGSWTASNQSPNYNWALAIAGSGTNYLTGDNVLFDNRATGLMVTISDATVSPASVTVNNDGGHNYVFTGSGSIAGSTGLTKSGTGMLTISNTNTYSGATTILGGTVSVGADANLGTAPGSATAGSIVLNGGALFANSSFTLNAKRGIALGPAGGSGSGTIDVAGGKMLTYGGIIANATGGTGGLIKTGNGSLNITAVSSFTGPTTINAGLVMLGASGQYGTLDNSTGLVINGGTVNAVNDNSIWGYRWGTVPNPVTIYAGGMLTGGSGTSQGSTHLGPVTLSGGTLASNGYNSTWGGWYLDGDVTVSGGTSTISAQRVAIPGGVTRTFTVNAGSVLNFIGNTQERANTTNTGNLTKSGGGLMILAGSNAYHGNTTISQGALQVAAVGAIPSGSDVNGAFGNVVFDTAANAAVLDINGFGTTINGLIQDSPSTTNMVVNNASGTTPVLTVGGNNASSTFAGVLADNNNGGSGILSLTKTGNGTLVLGGTNTFTGGTTVAGGTVVLTNNEALADGTSVTIGNAAAFAPVIPGASVVTPVPEPGTLALVVAGAALMAIYRRRHWRANRDRAGFGC